MTAAAGTATGNAFQPQDSGESFAAMATRTLDLAELAGIARGDRVEVDGFNDRTVEMFARTLNLLEADLPPAATAVPAVRREGFLPEHEDLRSRFLFAQAVGSYATLSDLLDAYSPGRMLTERYDAHARLTLTDVERAALENYLDRINDGLAHANSYLVASGAQQFSSDELLELHKVLIEARERAQKVTAILGAHLIGQVEHAVERLHAFRQQIRSVQRSVGGIFIVDSEVMFLPTGELIRHVETIFSGVGNAYLAEHIDGTLLLAARNLLIDAVSFYSYYGKHRIYDLYEQNSGMLNRNVITRHIRTEIRQLFSACKASNKLILRRMMHDAEREFELSLEAIQMEAEHSAVEAVRLLLPEREQQQAPPRRGLFGRLLGWFIRR